MAVDTRLVHGMHTRDGPIGQATNMTTTRTSVRLSALPSAAAPRRLGIHLLSSASLCIGNRATATENGGARYPTTPFNSPPLRDGVPHPRAVIN